MSPKTMCAELSRSAGFDVIAAVGRRLDAGDTVKDTMRWLRSKRGIPGNLDREDVRRILAVLRGRKQRERHRAKKKAQARRAARQRAAAQDAAVIRSAAGARRPGRFDGAASTSVRTVSGGLPGLGKRG